MNEPFNIERAKNFIAELELADTSEFFEKIEFAEPAKGYVNLGSLVSFVAGIDGQDRSDVLNSTLLAQLAANKKFDRERDTENWYKFYRNVLENIGWVIQDFAFTKFNTSAGDFTVDKVILEILSAIATGNELTVVAATIEALRSLSNDDGRIVLFESSSHSSRTGNFQIIPVTNSNGQILMRIAGFFFSTTQDVDKVLFFRYSTASAELYQGTQSVNLNKDIYNQVRQDIISKLGDRAEKFVRDLEI